MTGTLAGHNAARKAYGLAPLVLPDSLAVGDAISYVRESMQTEIGLTKKYTFSGSVYFARMQEKNLYTTDIAAVSDRVGRSGLTGIFAKPLI